MNTPAGLRAALLPVLLVLSAPSASAADHDGHGDDVPAGAVQRLGSLRLKYSSLRDARYLPDGRVIALSGSDLDVLDMATGLLEDRRKLPLTAVSADVGSDGTTLLLAGGDGAVCVYDLGAAQERRRWPTGQAGLRYAQFSPDGQRVLTVGRIPPTLKEWDADSGRERLAVQGKLAYYDKAVYALGGTRVVAGGGYDAIEFWDLQTGTLLKSEKTGYCVYDLVASPDGQRVLAGERSSATEWDVGQVALLKRFTGHHGGAVTGQAYGASPDEIFTGSRDGSVRRWNRLKASVLLRWFPHSTYAGSLRLSPDGRWLLSYRAGQYLTESDVQTGRPRLPLERHTAPVAAVAWTPDGKVVSGSQDGTARLWEPATGKCLAVLPAGQGASCVASAPAGRRLAVGGKDGLIREYDADGNALRELKGHRGYVRALCYLADGRLASAGDDGSVRLWTEAAEPERVLTGHRGGVLALALADRTHLASAGRDGSVRLWDTATGQPRWSHTEHRGYVTCLAARTPGEVVSAGRDGRILRWTVAAGRQPGEISTPGWVQALTVRADGTVLAACSGSPAIAAWGADGKPQPEQRGHVDAVLGLAMSADGARLASASGDGTLLVWQAPATP